MPSLLAKILSAVYSPEIFATRRQICTTYKEKNQPQKSVK